MTGDQSQARTCILVLGMHRSGTSATAGALGMCGVALGSELLAPGDDNPKGYFEHERAVGIDERLLAALGSGWADVRPLPAGWQRGQAARAAAGEIDALLASDFAGAPLFALKDPRMCRLLPAWLPALQGRGVRAVALFVARDPAEVAASVEARNGWAAPLGELLWLRYTCDAEAATRGIARTAISYEALLADPAGSLRAALARVGVSLQHAPEGALRAFADPGHRHQRNAGSGPGGAHAFAAPVAQARDALEAIASGADGWDAVADAGTALDGLWAASGGTLDALGAMAMDIERKARIARDALSADNARLRSDLNAQIAWSEAAVRERESLQAEAAGLRSELAAQVRWSAEAVVDWEARADRYERALLERQDALEALTVESRDAIAARDAELARRDAELAAIHRSVSWRLSRPLRALEAFSKRTIKRIHGKHRQ